MFAGGAPDQDPWVPVPEDSQEQLSGISGTKKEACPLLPVSWLVP